MECNLEWLVGLSITKIERFGQSYWRFTFGLDSVLTAECPWRVIKDGRIVLSSEDHGQRFGHPQPIDAESECKELIENRLIESISVSDETRDLKIEFGKGLRLEIIPLSSGYESWQISGPGRFLVVVQGGGNMAVWERDAEPEAE